MNEQELNNLLKSEATKNIDPIPVDEKAFQKKLKQRIYRTFLSRTFCVLFVFVLLVSVLYYGTSSFVSAIFYHPGHEKTFLQSEKKEAREFSVLLTDFLSMHFPGTFTYVIPNENSISYTSKGFGCYDINIKTFEPLDPMMIDGEPTNKLHIKWSNIKVGPNSLPFYHTLNEFKNPDPTVLFQPAVEDPQNVLQEIEKLPDSAWLDVSLSFEQYLSSNDIASLIHQYPNCDFNWIALKGQNFSKTPQVSYGMGLRTITREVFTNEASLLYPSYDLDLEHLTGKMLEECYHSHLQLLIDHPKFVDLMGTLFDDDISVKNLQKRLDYAKKDWSAYGVRVNIGKEDLLKLLSSKSISYVNINDVHVSKYEK